MNFPLSWTNWSTFIYITEIIYYKNLYYSALYLYFFLFLFIYNCSDVIAMIKFMNISMNRKLHGHDVTINVFPFKCFANKHMKGRFIPRFIKSEIFRRRKWWFALLIASFFTLYRALHMHPYFSFCSRNFLHTVN